MAKYLQNLPAEIVLRILRKFNSPIDVENFGFVARRFQLIISTNLSVLARPKCHFSVWLAERRFQICADNSNARLNANFQEIDEIFEKFFRLEILSLTLVGCNGDETSTSEFSTPHPASSHPVSVTSTSPSSTTLCRNENDDDNKFLRILLPILHRTRQYSISTFILKNLRVTSNAICANLLGFSAQMSCQQIVLKNCDFSAGFREADLHKMSAICQFTATECKFGSSINCADLFMRKFNHDIRYGSRRNMPHFISASQIDPKEICNFLNNWLHISDSTFFEIRVEDCGPNFQNNFLHECELQSLSQIYMEFPSRARSNAHVKAKYNLSERLFQMFPVMDTVSNTSIPFSRDLCYASYFRDF